MKSLNRSIVIAGGLVLSSIVVASLDVAGNIGHHHKRQHLVHATSIDSNGDGQLTRDEVLAHSRTRFDRLDANGDGLVSPHRDKYFKHRHRGRGVVIHHHKERLLCNGRIACKKVRLSLFLKFNKLSLS